ncbi:MAG: acyl-CoA dehydrogenase, partial [Deltaproteobacteria bacterium]|nr:acyl-CoA dehydrogenase [Deltaproteobacteria bacterium]
QAALEYLIGASFSFSAYALAGHGTAKMIELFGTDKQKELYLSKLYSGEWGGTMVLTEPEAGSDVGNLSTTAKDNGDGTYTITGNKIFITNGDHDLVPNIVHPVLARIEGAPRGTKGISLFLVPKYRVNDDGSLGEENDVACTGIEEKMGLHGSATCSLTFGGKGKCVGTLLGEVNKGMKVMFTMMNEARLAVGAIGQAAASCAYLYALDYAKQRVQGRDLDDILNPEAPPVPIIRHPDVKRMLLWMKAHVEGMRSLIYYCAKCFDMEAIVKDEEEREFYKGMTELLTPVIKSFCSDRGFDVCVQAVQVYGGYGYTKEFPVEQLARDSKINSIYEGTNGIQAMDLLGRKLAMKNGAYFTSFTKAVNEAAHMARDQGLHELADSVDTAVKKLSDTAMALGAAAMEGRLKQAFAHAYPFLNCMGDVCMAWMLLWRAAVAAPAKEAAKGKDAAFYEGQVKTAEFFIQTVLPVTLGSLESIQAMSPAAVEMTEEAFGG